MIPISREALELTEKYASGAPCGVDFTNIQNTMFYPHYELIAQKMGLQEINLEVVKKYWFEIHNTLVVRRFRLGNLDLGAAENCLVRAADNSTDGVVSIHGGIIVGDITTKEAKIIDRSFEKALRDLRDPQ